MQISRNFGSMAEFVDYCEGATKHQGYRLSQATNQSGFHGSASFADALKIAFNWADGVARIEHIKAAIQMKSQRTRKVAVAREAGPGVVSMGKFLAGHPQPYMNLEDSGRVAKGKGKIVKVVFNYCVSGGIAKEIIESRGAAMLALVAALEQAGRRVEIVAAFAVAGARNSRIEYAVTVKRPQQKLNLNSVAFALAHPDMLRRFTFAAMEREEDSTRKAFSVGSAYGKPCEIKNIPTDALYVGSALYGDSQWSSPEKCAAWVNDRLAEQGITVKR